MPPPQQQQQQQQRTSGRSRAGWTTLCYIVLAVLLFAGFVALIAWLSQALARPQPRFTVAALSVSDGGQVVFTVSDRHYSNPNRHYRISYKGATRASLLLDDGSAVASGQANSNTTSITGVLDVVDVPSFSATLRAGHGCLPLRLQLTTPISFRLRGVFPSIEENMHVNCHLLVGADGSLLRDSVGAPCHSYFLRPLQAAGMAGCYLVVSLY